MKLTKASTPDEIRKAAILSATGDKIRDQIKDQIWGQIEPEASKQIPDSTPGFLKTKALDIARKPVDSVVDKAIDEALKKLNEDKSGGGQGDYQAADGKGEAPEESD